MSTLRDRSPPEYAYCRPCFKDKGTKALMAIPVRVAMKERGGRLDQRTGRQKFICALCWQKGVITYLDD